MAEEFVVTVDGSVAEFLHDAYRGLSRDIDARLGVDPRPLFAPADGRLEFDLAFRDRLKALAIAAHEGRLVIMDREQEKTEPEVEETAEHPKPKPPAAGGAKRTPDGGEWVTER